jgi:very-short-patch-repair endonuclease
MCHLVTDANHARAFRRSAPWAERLMWSWLRDRRLADYKFRRQHPIGAYYLDFFCEEARLAVELDGGQHAQTDKDAHDRLRTAYLEGLGIKVIRFWNSQLRRNPAGVRATIYHELNTRAPHEDGADGHVSNASGGCEK